MKRHGLVGLLLLLGLTVSIPAQQPRVPRFRRCLGAAQAPPDMYFGEIAGVAVNSKRQRVRVHTHGRAGQVGADGFRRRRSSSSGPGRSSHLGNRRHALSKGWAPRSGSTGRHIWLVDTAGRVVKLGPDYRFKMVLGRREEAVGERMRRPPIQPGTPVPPARRGLVQRTDRRCLRRAGQHLHQRRLPIRTCTETTSVTQSSYQIQSGNRYWISLRSLVRRSVELARRPAAVSESQERVIQDRCTHKPGESNGLMRVMMRREPEERRSEVTSEVHPRGHSRAFADDVDARKRRDTYPAVDNFRSEPLWSTRTERETAPPTPQKRTIATLLRKYRAPLPPSRSRRQPSSQSRLLKTTARAERRGKKTDGRRGGNDWVEDTKANENPVRFGIDSAGRSPAVWSEAEVSGAVSG